MTLTSAVVLRRSWPHDPRSRSLDAAVLAAGSLAASPQPVLAAAGGLLLRPWADGDAPAFLAAYRDDEIRRWHTRRPSAEAQVLEWFEAYRSDWQREKGAHWAVTRDGGEVLGRIALRGLARDRLPPAGVGPLDP
ncbi:GNAT family N-acetyltransferase [Streptomyces cyaneofuscatus]